jgi:polysaccharide export outer membrane protein
METTYFEYYGEKGDRVKTEVPRSWRPLFALLLCASSLACTTRAGNPGTPSLQAEYRIAPPDTLTITVRPEPEIARTLAVRPDGRISFDLIGDVDVRARTVEEVRAEIAQRLREFIVQPDVTVVLARSESRTYFVFGEVARPGAYALVGDVTALSALGASGGPTRMAAQNNALLVRPSTEGELVYGVYYEAITQSGEGQTNYLLQPGDVIYVPPNGFARVGYALGVIFFPLQQILGLGGTVINAAVTGG